MCRGTRKAGCWTQPEEAQPGTNLRLTWSQQVAAGSCSQSSPLLCRPF